MKEDFITSTQRSEVSNIEQSALRRSFMLFCPAYDAAFVYGKEYLRHGRRIPRIRYISTR